MEYVFCGVREDQWKGARKKNRIGVSPQKTLEHNSIIAPTVPGGSLALGDLMPMLKH